jgi:hypothetical protein
VNDDDVDSNNTPTTPESDYESPAIFDFGPVFMTTRGTSSGGSDNNGQEN